jgi:hypothetical protein
MRSLLLLFLLLLSLAAASPDGDALSGEFGPEEWHEIDAPEVDGGDNWLSLPANVRANVAWLVANAKKEGVITLPSGLQYKILASGPKSGQRPKASDRCSCHYEGARGGLPPSDGLTYTAALLPPHRFADRRQCL